MRVPGAPHLCQHLVMSIFLHFNHSNMSVFSCDYLPSFIHSLVKHPLKSFAHFLNWAVCFLPVEFWVCHVFRIQAFVRYVLCLIISLFYKAVDSIFRPQFLTHLLRIVALVSVVFSEALQCYSYLCGVNPSKLQGRIWGEGLLSSSVPEVCGTVFRARLTHLQPRDEPMFMDVFLELSSWAPPSLSSSSVLSHFLGFHFWILQPES